MWYDFCLNSRKMAEARVFLLTKEKKCVYRLKQKNIIMRKVY